MNETGTRHVPYVGHTIIQGRTIIDWSGDILVWYVQYSILQAVQFEFGYFSSAAIVFVFLFLHFSTTARL